MTEHSRVRLVTESHHKGESWWSWAVWVESVDGGAAALERIESVTYVLHPTFPDPVRSITDRASKFRLQSEGWGEFAIEARVHTTGGGVFRLERWLHLEHSEEKGGGRRPCVFLSFGTSEAPLARALRDDLTKQGVDVVSPLDVSPGTSIDAAINEGLQRADLVAFMTSGELRGFAEIELEQTRRLEKPYVPILVGRQSSLPSEFEGKEPAVAPVHMYSRSDSGVVADKIVARVKDAFYAD